jgi:phospholipid/cholesterol/gamma-HCH transport system substrate-binding protein
MTATGREYRGHVVTFVIAVVMALGFLLFYLNLGGGLPSFGSTYQVQALFPTAGSLTGGARVTMAGVKVGTVTAVRRDGIGALVTMQIDDRRVTPIARDSRFTLRERTPVGENYVTIFPGSSSAKLRSGAVLPMTQANDYVDVDQLLSVLQGNTRIRARQLIQGLGGALQGRGGQLNALLGGATGALTSGSHVVALLAGDRAQVSRLVQNLGGVTAAVGQRRADIVVLARQALTSFDAISSRDSALRALLDQLPATLAQVRSTTTTLGAVTRTAAPVLFNLASAVTELKPAVQLLAPAAVEGRTVLDQLAAAAPPLQRTLSRLVALAPPASSALPAVNKTLCQVNPVIGYAKPYTPDIVSFIDGLGSASNSYDGIGHLIRITPIINDNTLVGLPPSVSKAAFTLLHAGLLSKSNALTFDPYPKPGQIGKMAATGKGSILGPSQVPQTAYQYPHVLAAC